MSSCASSPLGAGEAGEPVGVAAAAAAAAALGDAAGSAAGMGMGAGATAATLAMSEGSARWCVLAGVAALAGAEREGQASGTQFSVTRPVTA
jgi:hypothetical protein